MTVNKGISIIISVFKQNSEVNLLLNQIVNSNTIKMSAPARKIRLLSVFMQDPNHHVLRRGYISLFF